MFKKLFGKKSSSDCCNVEIKEVSSEKDSCCNVKIEEVKPEQSGCCSSSEDMNADKNACC